MADKYVDGGFFISLEGSEGVGKSTQARMLAQALRREGYAVRETREPGGTVLGEELRRLLKHLTGDDAPCPEAELLMMGASRAQLVRQVILPFLQTGGIVICDRFADSTAVYQGFARGLKPELIEHMQRAVTRQRWPDLTLILDLETEEGLKRSHLRAAGAPLDRFDGESREFHRAVRKGFLELAARHPERIRVIPAAGSETEVHLRLLEAAENALA